MERRDGCGGLRDAWAVGRMRGNRGNSKIHRLIPYDELNVGAYEGLDGDALKARTQTDYQKFAQRRAELPAKAAEMVCSGHGIDLHRVFGEVDE